MDSNLRVELWQYAIMLIILAFVISIYFIFPASAQIIVSVERFCPFEENFTAGEINQTFAIKGLVNLTNASLLFSTYNIEFHSDFTNNSQINTIFINSPNGLTIDRRDWSFIPGETQTVRNILPFTCPLEASGINFDVCSQFLDQFFEKEQPILFTLAGLTKVAQNELIAKTSELISCQNEVEDLSNIRTVLSSDKDILNKDLERCRDELTEPGGSCDFRIGLQKNESNMWQERAESRVDPFYFYGFWIVLISLIGSIIYRFTWGSGA